METNFVHQLIDQENSTAVAGKDVFALARAWNRVGIKPRAGIAHHDQHSAVLIAGDNTLDHLRWIFLRTMNDRVGQCFGESEFYVIFLADSTVHAAYHFHDVANYGVYGAPLG